MNLRPAILAAFGLLNAVSIWADKKLPVLQSGADIYSNVTVLSVSATDVYFTYNHGKGMANANIGHPKLFMGWKRAVRKARAAGRE